MEHHVIVFDCDGTAGALYADALAPLFTHLGHAATRRASDVEPDGAGWTATIRAWVPGGSLAFGPYATRAEALAAEVAYLERVL